MNKGYFKPQITWNKIRNSIENSIQIQQEAMKAISFIKSPEYQNLINNKFFIAHSTELSEAMKNISRISQINKESLETFRRIFGSHEFLLDNITTLQYLKVPNINVMKEIINEHGIIKATNFKISTESTITEFTSFESDDFEHQSDEEDSSIKEKVEFLTTKFFEPLCKFIVIANKETIGTTTGYTYKLSLTHSEWLNFFIILNTIQLILFVATYKPENKIEDKIK
ncbi:hypothetical protein I6D54_12435 [Staphylococcus aureus]|nr:hypothetical protein [Staphylococcus aureus]MBH4791636.1 hypothetical protein [Staphylococcus aureus]MBH4824985.1 hypothetical protein [Staphylococcus aureus]HBH8925068.1 hypothetical protein [Staphylococcus aureus]HCY8939533.1 hypothetical protein [Staphylococcus aureus]